MSESWANRERRTNRLVRAAGNFLFSKKHVTGDQLYGLCKLTWITNSYEGDNPAYLSSTKIPALGDVFSRDYNGTGLDDVAKDVVNITGERLFKRLILAETGFTNFYKAYRNSTRQWIRSNLDALIPLFRVARKLAQDEEGLELVLKIAQLPGIPKANHKQQLMRPEYLLTPVFFSLDPRLRFPSINGNKGVQLLLKKLQVTGAPLEDQYARMISLYGRGGIKDAADLDQVGMDLPDFVEVGKHESTKKLLEIKPTEGTQLPLKDESDIESLLSSRSIANRRIHNKLTNQLRTSLSKYTLLEGSSKTALFDVLVKDYDGQNSDLLIEVKSSIESAHLRMAIGQLMHYWFCVKGDKVPNIAILLPSLPSDEICRLLQWLGIGLMWYSGDQLETHDQQLLPLTQCH